MSGRIIIADEVAANRIVLKAKLTEARFGVEQALDVDDLVVRARTNPPDLIVMNRDLKGGGIAVACAALRSQDATASIPIIALDSSDDRQARLAALRAGADEVLAAPWNEREFLALIRNLIRARVTLHELTRRQDIARDFGLAEAQAEFIRPARIALIAPSREAGVLWKRALQAHLNDTVEVLTKSQAFEVSAMAGAPHDAFVIAADLADRGDGLSLISALQSHASTRNAVMLVLTGEYGRDQVSLALDMGATGAMPAPFDGEEVAARLRIHIARKIETDRMRQSLDRQLDLALRDPLTGLYNRRYAQSYLNRIARSAGEQTQPLTLMVLDLDQFKTVNDSFGHAVGDEVLIEVADRLRANLREGDLVARLGGEEFLVAMPETDRRAAEAAAERLRRVVGDRPVPSRTRGIEVSITISIGVIVADMRVVDPTGIETMIDRADQALYAAKAEGRNLVTFVRPAA